MIRPSNSASTTSPGSRYLIKRGSEAIGVALVAYTLEPYRSPGFVFDPEYVAQVLNENFEDAKNWFKSAYPHFSIIPYTWWVPRQFGSVYFPTSISVPLKNPEISPPCASSV